jgi:hypothetical protein
VSQDPYPPLRPQPPVRPRPRPTPWPTILGVALLGILAIILLAILLGGDGDGTADATPTPSLAASASGPAASAIASEAATAPPSGSPSGSASAGVALERDSIVATTAEELAVRAGPGTAEERLGSLANGTPAFVVDGPVDADGYRWYLLSGLGLPPNTGCSGPFETDPFNCPVWFGWVASASQEGEPWLTDDAGDADACAPTPVQFEEIVIGVTDLMRLHCFGSDPLTFRAWWPETPDDAGGACVAQDAPSGWLLCQQTNENLVTIGEEGAEGLGLKVSLDPASGVSMPERGTWVELTVHLDDPAASGCGEDATGVMAEERTPEAWVLFCRAQMVVESATAVDGP